MSPGTTRPAIAGTLLYALLIATYITFAPGLFGPFLLDDAVSIPRAGVDSLEWEQIEKRIFWSSNLGGRTRGLTNLSFTLTQYASGLNPYVFKYQNVLLHLINGALVFWLVSLLLGWRAEDKPHANLLALTVAAVWLLHPLQVSTVLYAAQRLVLLSSLFVLLALITYVKGRILGFQRPVAAFLVTFGGIALFGTLGIFSKESAALLPLYIAAIELFFFRLVAEGSTQRRLLHLLLLMLVALPLVVGLVYGTTHLPGILKSYASRDFTLWERLLTQLHALALYLKLFFVPLPASMSLFHDNFPVQRGLDAATIALAFSYAGLLLAALWMRNHRPAIGFGIVWFFSSHLMESTILPLELVFEHRNYLAILGLSMVLIVGMSRLLRTPKLRRVTPLLTVGLVSLLAFNTAARAFVWGNGELLLRTQYVQRPDSPRVLNSLYALELERGNLEAARRYLQEHRDLIPEASSLSINELRTYCAAESYPAALAEEARRKIEQRPRENGLFGALDSLTSTYLAGNCTGVGFVVVYDLVSAYATSDSLPSNKERFIALILQGRLLISRERWEEAEAVYSRALEISERKPAAYSNVTVNELFSPFLEAGRVDILGRLLLQVARPEKDRF